MLNTRVALKLRLSHLSRRISDHPNPGLNLLQPKGHGKTVAVAMSGGIDSAVAALLLQDQGYNCVGVFMKNWDPADECGSATCDISADVIDMRQVCKRLNIPAYEVDFVKEYWTEVFMPFLDAYQTGVETPNPDAFCNRFVKFNHFRKFVTQKLGIDTIATGHYARMVSSSETGIENGVITSSSHSDASNSHSTGVQMLRGLDPLKDQSYFLALTKGDALQNVLFPIGHMPKAQVKAIASQRLPGLGVLTKSESMGICFIGKRDMRDFLQDYISLTKGRFIDLDTGKVVGRHDHFEYFTIGQKARLPNFNHKYYVVSRKRNVIDVNTGDSVSTNSTSSNGTKSGGSSVGSSHTTVSGSNSDDSTSDTCTSSDSSSTISTAASRTEVSGDVYVVNNLFHAALFTPYIVQPLRGINWLAGKPPDALLATLQHTNNVSNSGSNTSNTNNSKNKLFRCEVKCRYAQLPTGCTMELVRDPTLLEFHNQHYNVIHSNLSADTSSGFDKTLCGTDVNSTTTASTSGDSTDLSNVMIKIVFDVPQRAITPGQILAIYENEVVLGGAVIAVQPLHLANGELLLL